MQYNIYLLTSLCRIFKKLFEVQIFDDALFLHPQCPICSEPEFTNKSLVPIQTLEKKKLYNFDLPLDRVS